MKRILALDLSLNHAGVGRLSECRAGQPVFTCETVHVPPQRVPGKKPGTEKNAETMDPLYRLLWWRWWFGENAGYHEWDMVMMEMPATHGVQGVLAFGEQLGVLKLAFSDAGIPLAWVSITEVKKYATGMGKPDDLRMVESAVTEFGEQVIVDGKDQADSLWICRIAHDAFGGGEPDTKYREAVCAKLRAQFPEAAGEG